MLQGQSGEEGTRYSREDEYRMMGRGLRNEEVYFVDKLHINLVEIVQGFLRETVIYIS